MSGGDFGLEPRPDFMFFGIAGWYFEARKVPLSPLFLVAKGLRYPKESPPFPAASNRGAPAKPAGRQCKRGRSKTARQSANRRRTHGVRLRGFAWLGAAFASGAAITEKSRITDINLDWANLTVPLSFIATAARRRGGARPRSMRARRRVRSARDAPTIGRNR